MRNASPGQRQSHTKTLLQGLQDKKNHLSARLDLLQAILKRRNFSFLRVVSGDPGLPGSPGPMGMRGSDGFQGKPGKPGKSGLEGQGK